ncbi:MAG: redoxin domain-containing protein [Gemmatimonadales bacterium]
MGRVVALAIVATAVVAVVASRALAQDGGPKVGDIAPDFTLKGSTKDGPTPKPLHLADFRGQTVVLAFFPKARTKG